MSDTEINWSDIAVPNKVLSIGNMKPNYNITFHNADGEQVGTLDFNGPGLIFEGNAEVSAIVFIDWIAQAFESRLKEEYERGLKDGRAT
jgi:hypothetical protein